jgi:outer membrane protein OmpA-like peptidoglycan-associated protein
VRFLVEQGVDERRLSAKGYGESQPMVANDSPENRALNRRTDFEILGL